MSSVPGGGSAPTATPSAEAVRAALEQAATTHPDDIINEAARVLGYHRNWVRELMRRYRISIVREIRVGEERRAEGLRR